MSITQQRFDSAKTDRRELDQIIELYRDDLGRFVASRVKTKSPRLDANDVLQETLLRAYKLFCKCEWRGERALFSWFCGIALHVIQEMDRRFLRINNDMPPDPDQNESTPSRVLRRKERFKRLEASIEKLSEDERRVIKLMRIEGIPLPQVAQMMNRSERGVYQLLWRSMKKLKVVFGDTVSLRLSDDRLNTER